MDKPSTANAYLPKLKEQLNDATLSDADFRKLVKEATEGMEPLDSLEVTVIDHLETVEGSPDAIASLRLSIAKAEKLDGVVGSTISMDRAALSALRKR